MERIQDLLLSNPSLSTKEAENFGEIWLIILCQTMRMGPSEGIALLQTEGALSRGVATGADKGRGKDVQAWISAVLSNRRLIGGLIERDQLAEAAVYSCLHPLSACLFSSDEIIVKLAAVALLALGQALPPRAVYDVVTRSLEPSNPRQPNAMLMGILTAMSSRDATVRQKIAQFTAMMCDLSSKKLRALISVNLRQPLNPLVWDQSCSTNSSS